MTTELKLESRVEMNDLLNQVVEAHGGLERWQQLNSLQASIVSGGDYTVATTGPRLF